MNLIGVFRQLFQCHGNPDDDTTSSGDDDDEENASAMNGDHQPSSSTNGMQDEPMEEDPEPGWTVVKTKRKNK